MSVFELWWHWFGPYSPMGETVAAMLTVVQIVIVAAVLSRLAR